MRLKIILEYSECFLWKQVCFSSTLLHQNSSGAVLYCSVHSAKKGCVTARVSQGPKVQGMYFITLRQKPIDLCLYNPEDKKHLF